MFITILSVIAGIIALVLVVALFAKKSYAIRRSITINAPAQKAFDYLKQLRNQDNFNKWVMVDPGMKRTFTGTDGTVGFIYGWNGNSKAGEGEQEIKNLVEGQVIDTEVRFVRPFAGVAFVNTVIESAGNQQATVHWTNSSSVRYPMNIMVPVFEKILAKDMDTSLSNLKIILEH